jgi:CheY-like chemotaxis protein
MKILVVDDRKTDRKLLSTILISNGYEVAEAVNGIDALKYLRKSKPGMIISDIMMPEMDGFTLLRELKKNKYLSDIPFIFYTAHYVSEKDKELAASLGASRFMVKPTEPRDLLHEIKTTFEEYEIGVIAPVNPLIETEEEYLKLYSDRIFRKLEEKISELEDTKNFLDTVLSDMGDGVMVMDPGLNVIYCNKRMHDILECDIPPGAISPDEHHSACIPDIAHASHKPFEIVQITQKDNIVHLEGIVSPVINENDDLTFHIGVFRDATERNRVQEEVEKKNREIARLYELGNMFSNCVSSDELIKCALEQIVDIMELEGGVVYLITENKIEIKWSVGLPPKFVELLQNQFPDSPVIQKVLDPDNLVIISPLSALIPGLTGSEQEHVEEHVEERIITIQLRVKGSLIGIVDLMASPYRDLSDDEVSLLEKFGMQFAVTLENFLKYEKLKQEVNEHK